MSQDPAATRVLPDLQARRRLARLDLRVRQALVQLAQLEVERQVLRDQLDRVERDPRALLEPLESPAPLVTLVPPGPLDLRDLQARLQRHWDRLDQRERDRQVQQATQDLRALQELRGVARQAPPEPRGTMAQPGRQVLRAADPRGR